MEANVTKYHPLRARQRHDHRQPTERHGYPGALRGRQHPDKASWKAAEVSRELRRGDESPPGK